MKIVLLVLVGLTVVCTQKISLRPYDQYAKHMFVTYDSNGDSIFSQLELQQSFRYYDTNGDQRVTRKEYTEYGNHILPELHELTHALYSLYDMDNDHILDLWDYEHLYKLIDSDEDGQVTEAEFVHFWTTTLESLNHLHPA
ncbi:uncharacterized protein LOC121383013 [Gigantopelta aegis]|uniref:uncharacterized protein LOC121383013 n=1 Tax=Gigantopelta aegis TaxID=1735272 RepID=UPI001B88A2F2|nr:uncharacterized protein LOC121383013 [Gigantopelta aegis]XP_041368678.1 uncharacterized protein LOC121383013 [Gigantopelta aegis]XP_041368679.1 uncharacterized protein LOC121383013 [Gigantopelta aegis]XP_041368680.1 uncharacterized protein LOC121383013 [Gigantopelta aegis]